MTQWTTHLPKDKESATIIANGIKQTTDIAKDVSFALGHKDAKKFYTTPLGLHDKHGRRNKAGGIGWSKESLHAVDWWAVDATLDKKSQMYKQ